MRGLLPPRDEKFSPSGSDSSAPVFWKELDTSALMSILQAVRGTRDLLPPETELWNHIEATARRVFERYAFGEIRTPIFEDTQLFSRGVGEETDIVSKEMYTFTPEAEPPRQGRRPVEPQSLTLRPENTAGVVRA